MDLLATAGAVSTALFAIANLPMLIKAVRTRDVRSYSRSALIITTIGNVLYTPYVLSMPAGPIWVLHTFYVISTAVILTLSLAGPSRRRAPGGTMSHAPGEPSRGGPACNCAARVERSSRRFPRRRADRPARRR